MSDIIDISPGTLDSSLCFIQLGISRVTIYSLDVLLSQFETSLLFYVQF